MYVLIQLTKVRPSNFMSQFPDIRKLVMKCLSFPTFKVRQMVVKSITALSTASDLLEDAICFMDSQNLDLNCIHGYLLIISEFRENKSLLSKLEDHCMDWNWIKHIKCDIIQALYYKICYQVYFCDEQSHKNRTCRKELWLQSKNGLLGPCKTGILSYSTLSIYATIYMSGINEFFLDADLDISSLLLNSCYDVQLAVLEYLNTFSILEKLNLQQAAISCFKLLELANVKEEVLLRAGNFLNITVGKYQIDFDSKMIQSYIKRIEDERFVSIYLPCIGSMIGKVF